MTMHRTRYNSRAPTLPGVGYILIFSLILCGVHPQPLHEYEMILRGAGGTFPRELYEAFLATYEYQRSYFVSMDTEYSFYNSLLGKQSYDKNFNFN